MTKTIARGRKRNAAAMTTTMTRRTTKRPSAASGTGFDLVGRVESSRPDVGDRRASKTRPDLRNWSMTHDWLRSRYAQLGRDSPNFGAKSARSTFGFSPALRVTKPEGEMILRNPFFSVCTHDYGE